MRRLNGLGICFVLLMVISQIVGAPTAYAQGVPDRSGWSMAEHDPQHTYRSASVGPAIPVLNWDYWTSDCYGESCPAVAADGTIYVSNGYHGFQALNPDGTERWTFPTKDAVMTSPAIGPDGTIYLVPGDGTLCAIAPDGSLKWKSNLGFHYSPSVSPDGTIYGVWLDSSDHGTLCALDPDGTVKWETADAVNPFVIGQDGTVYAASSYGKLCAIKPDGSKKWEITDSGSPSMVGPDGTLYTTLTASNGTTLLAINPDGSEKWRREAGPFGIGPDGVIISGAWDGGPVLLAINPDGSKRWEYPLADSVDSHVIDANGTTYLTTYGSVYAIGADGSQKWKFDGLDGFSWHTAIGPDGTLFVDDHCTLHAIGLGQTLVPPYLSVHKPSAAGTINGPVSYSIVYTNATAITLEAEDIQLIATGTATGTVSVSGTGTQSRSVTISNISGDGTLRISIAAGTATNAAGSSFAAGPSNPIEVDSARIGQGDWSMSGHDSQHTGRSSYAGPEKLMEKWETDLDRPAGDFSYPVISADGTMYICASDKVYALDSQGLMKKWECDLGDPIMSSAPAIGPSGTLYVSADNKLYCISAKGHLWWSFDVQGSDVGLSAPVVDPDGTIFVGCTDHKLYAINPDGTEKWNFETDSEVDYPPAVISDGTIYVGAREGTLYALSPDGVKKWEALAGSYIEASPNIASDGTIYVRSSYGWLYAFNPYGAELWELGFDQRGAEYGNSVEYGASAIGPDGTIYAASSGSLCAIDPNGTRKWLVSLSEEPLDSYRTASTIVDSAGTIYVTSQSGMLDVVRPDGTLKWSFPASSFLTPGAISSDGTFYAQTRQGRLYAFGSDESTLPPGVTIGEPSPKTYDYGPVVYTITYDRASQTTLCEDDITLNTTGTARGDVRVYRGGSHIATVEISNCGGNGTIGISVAAGTASNRVGLAPKAGPSATFTVANPPIISVGQPSATTTKSGPITYKVTYTDATAVTLKASDVTLMKTGTANGVVSVSGTGNATRTVTVSNITGNGSFRILIADRTASNAAGSATYGYSYTDCAVVNLPAVSIGAPSVTTTKNGPVTYTLTYTNATAITLAASNVTLVRTGSANGTVSISGSGTSTRIVTISGITGNGTLRISIAGGTASNTAGSAAAAGPSGTITVSNPVPTLWIGAPSVTTTSSGPVTYLATYTGATSVTLAASKVALIKTGNANGTVSVSGIGTASRILTISGITGNGTLGISIAAGTASNADGSAAAAQSMTTFAVNNPVPTLSISAPSVTTTNTGPVTYTVSYTRAAAVSLVPSNVTLTRTGNANGTVSVSGVGMASRVVTISGITGNGTLRISIAAGSASNTGGSAAAAGPSSAFTVSNPVPALSISAPSLPATKAGPIIYTVTYTRATSVTLTSANVTLNKTGTAKGTVSVTGTGTATRRITISNISGDGTLGITIAAGTASNVGGPAPAVGPSSTFTVVNTTPKVTIGAPSASSTIIGPVSYVVTYTNATLVFLTPAKVHLLKTGTATGTVLVTGSGNVKRTVTIIATKGKGSLGISIDAGTALNAAGLATASGPSATFAVKGLF